MRRRLILLGAAGLALACGVVGAGTPEHARAAVLAGGCGGTKLYNGALPAWTAPAMADSSGGAPPWPHALSSHRTVAAIVFGYPLQAGRPKPGRQNKVLWIMRLSRRGLPLHITARPLHSSHPVVRETEPANAGPGQVYPSYVNVPRAGCWRISLRWAGHTGRISLLYEKAQP